MSARFSLKVLLMSILLAVLPVIALATGGASSGGGGGGNPTGLVAAAVLRQLGDLLALVDPSILSTSERERALEVIRSPELNIIVEDHGNGREPEPSDVHSATPFDFNIVIQPADRARIQGRAQDQLLLMLDKLADLKGWRNQSNYARLYAVIQGMIDSNVPGRKAETFECEVRVGEDHLMQASQLGRLTILTDQEKDLQILCREAYRDRILRLSQQFLIPLSKLRFQSEKVSDFGN